MNNQLSINHNKIVKDLETISAIRDTYLYERRRMYRDNVDGGTQYEYERELLWNVVDNLENAIEAFGDVREWKKPYTK